MAIRRDAGLFLAGHGDRRDRGDVSADVPDGAAARSSRSTPSMLEAARTLGASEWEVFLRVALPLAWPGILAGTVLSFARVARRIRRHADARGQYSRTHGDDSRGHFFRHGSRATRAKRWCGPAWSWRFRWPCSWPWARGRAISAATWCAISRARSGARVALEVEIEKASAGLHAAGGVHRGARSRSGFWALPAPARP